ncbi:MAG TPA: serine/threonine-protein kinase [Verrucomicrobiae bacterium]|nr:serine/threonine-protein kinase [Verrucomicrobiae bacterium]
MKTCEAIAAKICPTCGGEIPRDISFQQCPRCLLELCCLPPAAPVPEAESASKHFIQGVPFGDYEILERLGHGGMGVVYKARQRSLDRIVALKSVRMGDLASPADLARFRREAEAAAKLDHPRIVPIYEVGEHEANPFLVMRYIPGWSLAEKLPEFTNASDVRAGQIQSARILATMARAVHYAHGRGVLHRDLKPSNILLDRDLEPYLSDFGIAQLADQESALTQTAELIGTPSYMSPEQAAGKRVDCRADIYSLGAILYEILTGRPPFQGARPVETLRQVIHDEPLNPRAINCRSDPELSIVALKCIDKDPARRYPTAIAFAEDLERWLRREPVLAHAPSPALRARRWLARNPLLALLIAGLVVGITVTSYLLVRTQEEQRRKSIALAILRTESARQLQEIWDSPKPFFAIRSETLAAMAGREPVRFPGNETRLTLAFVVQGNPLDRVLGAASLLQYVEIQMKSASPTATRLDLRIYKRQAEAILDFIAGDVDFLQMNAREYVEAKASHIGVKPLLLGISSTAADGETGDTAVLFTRKDSGVERVADARGRSMLFGREDSTLTYWAKVHLANAGITQRDMGKVSYLGDAPRQSLSDSHDALGNPYSDMTPVDAVVHGRFDIAVVREVRFRQVAERHELVAIGRFRDSGYMIAGQPALSATAAEKFRNTLAQLNDRQMLQTFTGFPKQFAPCSDSDFDDVRHNLTAAIRFDSNETPK